MDNATKAIIFAAGLLIGVLLISISMYMLTAYRGVYDQSMDEFERQQITSFNSFFTQYGPVIKGYDVYNIIGKINEVNAQPNSNYFIHFDNSITREASFYYTENFLKNYNYEYQYDIDGVIYRVIITEAI